MLGGNSSLDPPDPIPNSEVKQARADDSVDYPCESRSPPGSLSDIPPQHTLQGVLFFIERGNLEVTLAVDVSFILNICYNAQIVYGLSAHFLFVAGIWIYTVCWNPR